MIINKASLVQLVERRFPKPDVVGSSPTGRDFKVIWVFRKTKLIYISIFLFCTK